MRRIRLYMEEDIDDALSIVAAQRGMSRSAVKPEAVRSAVGHAVDGEDPLDALVGSVDVDPDDDIDVVIYDIDR